MYLLFTLSQIYIRNYCSVNANSASMCNYEVMVHLQKLKDTKTKQTGQLATITYEVLTVITSM